VREKETPAQALSRVRLLIADASLSVVFDALRAAGAAIRSADILIPLSTKSSSGW
jgi:hypothetical protein